MRDANALAAWLGQEVLPHEHQPERVQALVYERCRAGYIEPLLPVASTA